MAKIAINIPELRGAAICEGRSFVDEKKVVCDLRAQIQNTAFLICRVCPLRLEVASYLYINSRDTHVS